MIGNSSIEFKIDTNIGSQGFTSLHYVLLAAHLESDLNLKISPAIFFQFNTIEKIFEYFSSKTVNIKNLLTADIANSSNSIVKNIKYSEDIAVIGLWLRFPGAANHEEFWRNLLLGYNAITEIPLDRWDWKEYFGNPKDIGNYTDAIHGAFVNDIDIFAASFFHISPREANLMDPRQRLMLEGAWGVIEDAGYNPRELYGAAVGVFIGATGDEYERAVISKLPASDAFALTGVSPTILANRISYFFDWSGPSEVIDTACSSSLVAIHRAVQSMRNKECDFAIVGGTNLLLDQNPHISLSKLGMLSSDGKCKAFANNANGYVRGEGFAWVFLKFTESAVMNKDSIYAIIKATGVNHGGKSNSLTAPNPVRQAELLYNVYKKTNVDIRQIGFIEAHGTGTSLGDPIEFNGLTNAFKRLNSDNEFVHQFCALGSVKGNIGHLEAAAGIAGFIKLVLSIKHQKIPPTLHIKEINPNIILTSTPFFLPTETIDWIAPVIDGQVLPRIGGVSSFGFGGVYSHVVLSEYVEQEPQPSTIYNDLSIFTLTGSNETELESYINQLLIYLENHEISKESFEYILQLGRHHFCYRKLVICTTLEELKSALRAIRTKQPSSYIFDMQNIELLSNTALSKNIQMDLIKWLQGDTWKQIKFLDKVKRINIPISVLKKDKYWPKKPNEVNLPRFSVLQQKISLTTNELLWLIEHKIADKIILPGMVIIDWALEHLHSQLIDRNVILSVQDIFWQSPIYLDLHGMEIFINLTSKEENKYLVELSLLDMHSKISFTINIGFSNTMILNQSLDLSNYQNNSIHMYTQQECYDKFISIGVELGKPFRTIKKAFFLENSALFQIKLDELIPHSQKRSIVMDAALQASSLFYLLEYGNSKIPIVPFAIDILKIMQSINFINGYIEIKIIHQKNIKLPKYDAFIYDNNCNLLIYMQGIVGRSLLKPQSILHRPPVQYYQYQEKLFLQLGDKKNYDSNDMYKFLYVNISTDVANYYNSFVLTSRQDNFSKMSNLGIYFKDLLLQGLNSIVIYSEYSGKDHALQILEYEFSKIHKIFSYLSKVVVKSKLFIMLSFPITPSIHKLLMSSFEGYMLSLMKENHLLIIKILGLNGVSIKKILSKTQQLSQILLQNSYSGIAFTVDINYQLKFFDLVKISAVSLNSQSTKFTNDIYIIVGGSRGIGLQLAKFLAKTHNSTVVIIARNKPVNESFDFYAANVNVFDELKDVMEQIIAKYKTIAGVFYCAGIINDSLAILKTADKALEVIFPKVIGAINIYQIVSKLNNLKFLVYFSSLVSCTGNLGQVDYAYANKFLDLYAEHLNKNEKNNFRIVAISWPVWQDGSMKLSEKNLENYIKTSGMVPIDNLLGFNILEDLIFNYQYPHVCIK
ncbi:MAG TPA: SDR family NAD(P)-dependent oxidoreductase [Burkholderiales bacterium]|nr:SDR family NAD(P)-dependent oxidoreductase [Burkholderiales bacterium]